MSQITDPDALLHASDVVINYQTEQIQIDGELFPFKLTPGKSIHVDDDGLRNVVTIPVMIIADDVEVIR